MGQTMRAVRGLLVVSLMVLAWGCVDDEEVDTSTPLDDYSELQEPVEIRFDNVGIPHIYAENDLDLFYAVGYQQAKDRLFAVEISRRKANGTYAEALGERGVSTDVQSRTLGFRRLAELTVEKMRSESPRNYNLLVAFSGGLNRRVSEIVSGTAEMPEKFTSLGIEPEFFTPVDLMAIGTRIQFGFSSTLEFDILNTVLAKLAPGASDLPVYRPGGLESIVGTDTASSTMMSTGFTPDGLADAEPIPDIQPFELEALFEALARYRDDLDVGEGSNSFAIHGDHTFNGKPIIANDSHAGFDDPNTLYLAHYNSTEGDGTWNAMGFGFTGVPGVQLGHNDTFAWGATTNFADQTDLWDVPVEDGEVTYGEQPIALEEREETIRVKQEDGTFTEQTLTVREVPGVGVLLPDQMLPLPGALLANGELLLGWPGFQAINDFDAFIDLQQSKDLDDFEAAIRTQQTGMQNWTGITADGMRYLTHGLVPDRNSGTSVPAANQVMDGSEADNVWTGQYLSDERLPFLDGSQPFISTANNDPWGHTFDDDPLNDDFYYGSFFAPGYRAERLDMLLTELTNEGGITREQMQELQMDVHSAAAERILPMLSDAVGAIGTDPTLTDYEGRDDLVDAAARLEQWDDKMRADSETAALFRIWFALTSRKTLEDDMSVLYDAIDEAQPVTMVKFTVMTYELGLTNLTDDEGNLTMVEALDEALTLMDVRGEPTWGELHVAEFEQPDEEVTTESRGGGDTSINVAQSRCWDDDGNVAETCRSTAGAVFRTVTIIDRDDTPVTWFNWPKGNAGDTQDWLSGDYKRWPFSRAEVVEATAQITTLE
ncbi:MAG: penicillin acylase family protein [Myxococcota bacterium]